MKILLTGGAGYIGSHTAVALLEQGYDLVIVDNLSNSNPRVIERIKSITGKDLVFYKSDIRDKNSLDNIFKEHNIEAVIHFAGLKAVSESIEEPLKYYANNIDSSLTLLDVMHQNNVNCIVFSSSATVYGSPELLPITEESRVGLGITNPYGQTKYMIEQIITDVAQSDKSLQAIILRYFNPVGAHPSGLIGEDPSGTPNNLLPYVAQVAIGRREKVNVFGNNYNTPDGTGVRDYIHVVDLAQGHINALEHITSGVNIYNLGTGKGTSVLEIIDAFSTASGKDILYDIKPRRPGDLPTLYANPSKAERELDWKAKYDIAKACEDTWRWQSRNPNGYSSQ